MIYESLARAWVRSVAGLLWAVDWLCAAIGSVFTWLFRLFCWFLVGWVNNDDE